MLGCIDTLGEARVVRMCRVNPEVHAIRVCRSVVVRRFNGSNTLKGPTNDKPAGELACLHA